MKKIYCITSGEYSDWCINYSFESEKKRDILLGKLSNNYKKYDIELDDDKIDVEKVENVFSILVSGLDSSNCVDIYACEDGFESKESKTLKKYNFRLHKKYTGEITLCVVCDKKTYEIIRKFGITREKKQLKLKYAKIYQDKLAELNYICASDCVSVEKAIEVVNEKGRVQD